ncbi:WD40/YVTN/BNR-like repeat-containing protein [Psychrosphaera aestuarii]|uniref:WD40/YVTN/BNR-like repeat-containing protein n=1 Tax=Psychrosphaera aestuarii TaxID=1266052 RepID=UPI001B32515B|nr:YCF48-related protein [Psychrosphaera aestuarii]
MTKISLYPIVSLLVAAFIATSDASASVKISIDPTKSVKSDLASTRLLTDIISVGQNLVAVGERGHIILSDNGVDWTQANVPVNVLLTSIAFSNESVGYAVGHDATILKTVDGGKNWELLNYQPELDRPLLSITAVNNSVIAVGAYGLYWQSDDLGVTWQQEFHDELLLAEDREFLLDMKESDPEVYETEKQYLLPHFNDIYVNKDTWYLAGEAGFLATSNNQGKDWVKLPVDYYGSFFSLANNNNNELVVAGLRGNIFEQKNQDSWSEFTMKGNATINDILVIDGALYLFANSGNLYFSKTGDSFNHHIFEDGKAVMAGALKNNNIVLATEAGIKSISLATLK